MLLDADTVQLAGFGSFDDVLRIYSGTNFVLPEFFRVFSVGCRRITERVPPMPTSHRAKIIEVLARVHR